MGVKEKALTAASSIASGDFLRMVTGGGASRKIDYSKLAKAIVEEYNGSTIAGSAQTLKVALDSLNSKTPFTQAYLVGINTTEKVFNVEVGTRARITVFDSSENHNGMYIFAATGTGVVLTKAISAATDITITAGTGSFSIKAATGTRALLIETVQGSITSQS